MDKPKVNNTNGTLFIPFVVILFYCLCIASPYAVLLPLCCLFGFTTKVYKFETKQGATVASIVMVLLACIPPALDFMDIKFPAVFNLISYDAATIAIMGVAISTTLYIGRVVRSRMKNATRVVHEKTVKAETDKLTGLPNRQSMSSFIIKQAEYAAPFSIIMMDIDNFKKVNDTYGHTEGDVILQCLANVIRESIRQMDKCFRYGGEEFCVVCPQSNAEQALTVAERIRESFNAQEHNYEGEDEPKHFSVSLGIAECRYGDFVAFTASGLESEDPEERVVALINKADTALYKAKHSGKNKVITYFPEVMD